jgi:Tol biopolymer transport system component
MSWSPDGKWLAVPSQTGVFQLPADGGEARAATVPPRALERQYSPAYSPDGRTLAFFLCGASTVSCRIYLQPLAADGSAAGSPRQLFEKPLRAAGIAWSRDGSRLIFSASTHQGGTGFLWQVSASGAEPPARLRPAVEAFLGGISLVGERLAFPLALGGSQVWQASEGGLPRPLIRSAVWDSGASFSPDGRRVVFQSNRGGDGDQIFAANADGTGAAQLTGTEVIFAANPVWSPDGKWLAFQSQREDGNFDVVIMDSAGGPLRRLTAGNNNVVPSVSRDGSRVWFVSNRTGQDEIWSVPFSGGREIQFTSEGRRAPQESPDGKTLYCLDSSGTLYARNTTGGPEGRVMAGVVGYAPMDDGFYVVRRGEAGATPVLYFVDLTGAREQVVSEAPAHWNLNRAYLSVSPDRRRFLYSAMPTVNLVIQMVDGLR